MNMAVTYKHIDEMKPWSDKLHLLECISVTPETPDVMTFLFRSEDQNWFRYLPGQFVTLELPVGKEPLYRTYTLSSSPSRPYALSVTVKAQATSIGTRWMFDNLKPGMKIRALGPLGDFSYVRHPGDKYLFISAGSGVTPMMSMVRDMSDRAPQSDIAFINCSRSPSDIVFRHELEYLARFMPKLSLGFIVENCGRTDLWSGLKGMVDKAKIALLSPDFMDRTVFCCGPEPFMAAIRSMLDASGFDMSRYHQESFSPAAPVAVGEYSHRGGWRSTLDGGVYAFRQGSAVPARPDRFDDGARRRCAHRCRLRIGDLRHLPGAEALRRGGDEPQWRHSR